MTFFKWITVAKKQLIDSLQLSDEDFRAKAEAAFGRLAVQNSWGSKYNAEPPKVISSSNYAKPLCNYNCEQKMILRSEIAFTATN